MLRSDEAEMAVLGCLMLEPERAGRIFSSLPAKCFGNEELRKVYSVCRKRFKKGEPIDFVTLSTATGNPDGLGMCMDIVSTTGNTDGYIDLVIDFYRKREIYSTCMNLCEEALNESTDADELTGKIERALDYQHRVIQARSDSNAKEFTDALLEYFEQLYAPQPKSWKTGFSTLNRMLGGIMPETFTVLAGRSGRGKTAFALNLAVNLARSCRVLYLSMEMPKKQIIDRIAARIAHKDSISIRDGSLTAEEKADIQREFDILVGKGVQMVIDDCQQLTLDDLERKIIRWKPDVVFVDHVGLMKGDPKKQRWEVFTEISQSFKTMAMKHKIAVFALAQQTSDVEKRANKKANMSDVKGTDSFSNDADAMLFITADVEASENAAWVDASIQIVKNRNGSCGEIPYHWMPKYHEYIEVMK